MGTERDARHDAAPDERDAAVERRARELLADSAEHLEGRVRARLIEARHEALAELTEGASRTFRVPGFLLPAGALAAAAVLALAVSLRTPSDATTIAGGAGPDATVVEDLVLLATADEPELHAEDADFYEWARVAADDALAGRGG